MELQKKIEYLINAIDFSTILYAIQSYVILNSDTHHEPYHTNIKYL